MLRASPILDMSSGAPESGIVHHKYRQFQVVGRLKPSAVRGTRKADIYKMNVFADNEVQAKSRFWYYMSMLNRVKKANGEILQINEVCFMFFSWLFLCLKTSRDALWPGHVS